jgi:hypothetical protein
MGAATGIGLGRGICIFRLRNTASMLLGNMRGFHGRDKCPMLLILGDEGLRVFCFLLA